MKREQIEDVIIFVNILTKAYYNKFYIVMRLARDSITYLRLHYKYEISDLINRKLYYQRMDFVFKYKFYKIEKLLKKRDIKKNIMYLIKWKNCDNEYNV